MRGYSGMGPYRKNSGAIGGIELYQCPQRRVAPSIPSTPTRPLPANFRGPEFPQGFFGIQSMMDDVAYKMKMDPVEFVAEEHDAQGRTTRMPYTNYTLEECIRRGAEAFDWKKRWHAKPGSDAGPIKRGAGHVVHGVPLGPRPQQRGRFDVDSKRQVHRASSASPTSAPAPRPRWD